MSCRSSSSCSNPQSTASQATDKVWLQSLSAMRFSALAHLATGGKRAQPGKGTVLTCMGSTDTRAHMGCPATSMINLTGKCRYVEASSSTWTPRAFASPLERQK
eukprot:9140396-Pyramimonas_sp.AAC.1